MKKQQRTTIFLLIAALIIIACLIFWVFAPAMSGTLIDTVPEHPPETNIPENSQLSALSEISIDTSNVQNVIATMKRPSEYYQETQSTLSYNSKNTHFLRKRWVKASTSRIDIYNSPSQKSPSKHYVYTENNVYIWRPDSKSVFKTAKSHFNADSEQMIMTYEDIIDAPQQNISVAKLISYEDSSCIYTEIINPDSGYTEKYWISTSTGLLLHGQTTDENGNVIYDVTSTHTDISSQAKELFQLPDGSTPT